MPMKHRKGATSTFYPSSCSCRIISIMSVTERSMRKPLWSSGSRPLFTQYSACLQVRPFWETLTLRWTRDKRRPIMLASFNRCGSFPSHQVVATRRRYCLRICWPWKSSSFNTSTEKTACNIWEGYRWNTIRCITKRCIYDSFQVMITSFPQKELMIKYINPLAMSFPHKTQYKT